MEDLFTSARAHEDQVNTTMNLPIDLFALAGETEPATSAVEGVRRAITGGILRLLVRARISAMAGLMRLRKGRIDDQAKGGAIAAGDEGTFLVDLSQILGEQAVEERVYHDPIDIRDIAEHVTLSTYKPALLVQIRVQLRALNLLNRRNQAFIRSIESLSVQDMQELLGDILAYKKGEISLKEFSELWEVGSLTVLQ